MADIKAGDVVQLKSGGPKMTVSQIGDFVMSKGIENGAKCTWFDKTTLKEDVFHMEALKLYETPAVGAIGYRVAR